MKRKVYRKRYDSIRFGFLEQPIRDHAPGSMGVKIHNDGTLGALTVAWVNREDILSCFDAVKAFATSATVADFCNALNETGYENQDAEPFRTAWKLERTLEEAERLKEQLGRM